MSSGRRWAQLDDDSARLPEGMRRVGYDADSRQYTFRDERGALYQSDPGNRYGVLRPSGTHAERAEKQRPTMFEGNAPRKKKTDRTSNGTKPLTFQDIVPAELITSTKHSTDGGSPPKRSPSSQKGEEKEKEKRRGHSRHMSTTSALSSSSSPKRHIEFTEEPTNVGDLPPKERFDNAPRKKKTDQTSTGTKPPTSQEVVPAELIPSPKYSTDGRPTPPPKRSPSSRMSQEKEKEKRRGHSRHMSTTSAPSSSSSPKRHIEFTEEPTSVRDISSKDRFDNAPRKKKTDQISTGTKPLTLQDVGPAELITSHKYSTDGGPTPPPKTSPSSRMSQEKEKEKRRGHSRHMSTSSAPASSSSAKRHIEFTEKATSVGDISPKERVREAAKASGMPKMQGLVQSLRRSITSVTRRSFGGRKAREEPQSEVKDEK